jgi:hypothetical protein
VKIMNPGRYRLTQDFATRGSNGVATLPAGTVLEITQVDAYGRQVIGPQLLDWEWWDMPVEVSA